VRAIPFGITNLLVEPFAERVEKKLPRAFQKPMVATIILPYDITKGAFIYRGAIATAATTTNPARRSRHPGQLLQKSVL
jgi:hypothetical protein